MVDSVYQTMWFSDSQIPGSVSVYPTNDTDSSDAETPDPCFDSDLDDSKSDVDACSEADGDCG